MKTANLLFLYISILLTSGINVCATGLYYIESEINNPPEQRTTTYEELDKIDDVYYDKLTAELFTGIIQDMTSSTDEYMRVEIKNGIAHGFFRGFYDEERTILKWETQFIDGKMEGEYTHYFEDGQVRFTANMKAGMLDGLRYCYYDTGELMHVHHYEDGKEHGTLNSFYKNGMRVEIIPYINGMKNGVFRKYHNNGNLKQKGTFKNDKLNGILEEYNEDGEIQITQKYKNGELIL